MRRPGQTRARRGMIGRTIAVLSVTLAAVLVPAAPALAGPDDFTISDFRSDFYLSADENGNAVLRTVETIVAEFPDFDQNHGIERAIPTGYDGHPTDLEVISVTDGSGQELDWHEPEDSTDGFLVMRVGTPTATCAAPRPTSSPTCSTTWSGPSAIPACRSSTGTSTATSGECLWRR